MSTETEKTGVPRWVNSAVEFAPLAAFLAAWLTTKDWTVATITVMVASTIAVIVSLIVQRKIPWMPLVTAVLVGVFGGMTLYFDDPAFIKMKPSIVNTLFATVLIGSLYLGKMPIKFIMGTALQMPDHAWRTLTLRTAVMFLVLAIVNEAVWRTQPDDIWIWFRFPGLMVLTMLFFGSQVPFMMKHGEDKDAQ